MPRQLPKYCRAIKSRGRLYHYFIHNRRIVARFQDEPGTAAFHQQYAKLLRTTVEPQIETAAPEGSVGWLIASYKRSPAFLSKGAATQVSYLHELDRLKPIHKFRAEDIKRRHINAIRNMLMDRPRTQELFGQVVSLLWNYGIEECDFECVNPARRMKRAGKAKAYVSWTEAEMRLFEASAPPSHLMTAYMIARYTGPRRTDNVDLRRNAYDGRGLYIKGSKSDTPNYVRAHDTLKAYLDTLPPTLTIIADELGRPIRPERLSKDMRRHLNQIGLPHLHLHGLRHAAGAALADAGCSSKEIAAVLGHKTLQMVEKYTKGAEQRRLADQAIVKLQKAKTRPGRLKQPGPEAR